LQVYERAIANEVLHATDESKQERKLTSAETVRLPGAQAEDLAFLCFVAREEARAKALLWTENFIRIQRG
jgi:hypothetical protein